MYRMLGQQIAARRKKLAMTQSKLAEQVRMSRASIANIERGRQNVLVHHLYRFAEALDMPEVAELLPPLIPVSDAGEELLGVSFSTVVSQGNRALMTDVLNQERQRKNRS